MGSGFAQTAIAVIRNNKSLLLKRRRGKGLEGGYKKEQTEFDLPKATPKQL